MTNHLGDLPMNTREAVAARILELCKERGITPNGLSNVSAVPQATIKEHPQWRKQEPRNSHHQETLRWLRDHAGRVLLDIGVRFTGAGDLLNCRRQTKTTERLLGTFQGNAPLLYVRANIFASVYVEDTVLLRLSVLITSLCTAHTSHSFWAASVLLTLSR